MYTSYNEACKNYVIFPKLGVKLALKICIQQGDVIEISPLQKGLFCLRKVLRLVLSVSCPETQSRLGKCVQLQKKILIEKQSAQKPYIFFLGVKPALKICIQQGQVIIYRNFTTRKGTFLFKELVLLLL